MINFLFCFVSNIIINMYFAFICVCLIIVCSLVMRLKLNVWPEFTEIWSC